MVDVRYATGPSGRSSPSSWTPSSVGHSRRDHEGLASCPGRVRRATLPRSMTPKTQAPRESLRCFGARTPCRVTVAGAHTHTLNGGLSGAVKDQQRKGETIMDGPAEESVAGCGSRALSTTPPRRVRSGGCRNSRRIARSCETPHGLPRPAGWSLAICTPITPIPSPARIHPGRRARPGRQIMLTVGLTLSNSQILHDPMFTQFLLTVQWCPSCCPSCSGCRCSDSERPT